MSKKVAYYKDSSDIVEQMADKVIWGVMHPDRRQEVRMPRSQPETVEEWLESMFGDEDYYDYYDYEDYYSSRFGGRNYGNRDVGGQDAGNQATAERPGINDIVRTKHQETTYTLERPLYLLHCVGRISYSIPTSKSNELQAYTRLAAEFMGQELGAVAVTVLAAKGVGSCLRVHLSTNRPDEDFVYVDLIDDDMYFCLGLPGKGNIINFHKVGTDIICKHI